MRTRMIDPSGKRRAIFHGIGSASSGTGRASFFLTGLPYGQQIWVKWAALVLVITTNLFNDTLHETSGVRIGTLLRIADIHAIVPNR